MEWIKQYLTVYYTTTTDFCQSKTEKKTKDFFVAAAAPQERRAFRPSPPSFPLLSAFSLPVIPGEKQIFPPLRRPSLRAMSRFFKKVIDISKNSVIIFCV